MKTVNIKGMGDVKLNEVNGTFGMLEAHVPLSRLEEYSPFHALISECSERYAEDVFDCSIEEIPIQVAIDTRVTLISDINEDYSPKEFFLVDVYLWDAALDGLPEDKARHYDNMPLELDKDATRQLKRIIYEAVGKKLFG